MKRKLSKKQALDQALDQAIEALPDHLKGIPPYIVSLEESVQEQKKLFVQLESFSEYTETLSEIESLIDSLYLDLMKLKNGVFSVEDLEFEMRENTHDGFSERLDISSPGTVCRDVMSGKMIMELCEDVDSLVAEMFEEIRQKGFDLCLALKGS